MEGLLKTINGISRFLNVIAGISLTFLMLLTIADVILRLVAFAGAVVIGFSMPPDLVAEGAYFCRFFYFKVFPKGERHLQYCHEMRGDRVIFPDRLEPYQIWNGPTKIRGGFPYFTDAFLSSCLWGRGLLFYPMPGDGVRYREDLRREIR
jgi:hypothetical protein